MTRMQWKLTQENAEMSTTAQLTKADIIQGVLEYVRKCGGTYAQWYIGIATDAETRLFNDHSVDKANGAWIYRRCASSGEARAVEDYFLLLGMKGGPGGGDATTKIVYAYRIMSSTRE
jgi:hypothetical protein